MIQIHAGATWIQLMLTDIWFTPGYTFANFWFCPELGWQGMDHIPLPKK